MRQIVLAITLTTLLSSACADTTLGTREVLLDNQTVEVVRLTYPVGSESGMHTHKYPNRAVYFVQGGTMQVILQDTEKTSNVMEMLDGTASFVPASTHNIRNIGNTEIIIIETEIK